MIWSRGSERTDDIGVVANLGCDQVVDLVEEPFPIRARELSRHVLGGAGTVGHHQFALVVLKEIIWRLRIVNCTRGLVPEPLLGFVVSHLVLQEQVPGRPVGSPVLGVGGEHEVVIGLLVGLLEMEVHASFWLHGGECRLLLNIGHVEVECFFSVAVKHFHVESDVAVIWNNAIAEWGFCPGAAP